MQIFVSSQAVDRHPARDLIGALSAAGLHVEHSPSNPADRDDALWVRWYDSGLPRAVGRCDMFVMVIDIGWDSSTWMGIEAEAFEKKLGSTPNRYFFWNPEGRVVRAGMVPYLKHQLPRDLMGAITVIADQVAQVKDELGKVRTG